MAILKMRSWCTSFISYGDFKRPKESDNWGGWTRELINWLSFECISCGGPPGPTSCHRFAQNEKFMAHWAREKLSLNWHWKRNFFGGKRGKQKSSITQMESDVWRDWFIGIRCMFCLELVGWSKNRDYVDKRDFLAQCHRSNRRGKIV